jgi:hypothetical protein
MDGRRDREEELFEIINVGVTHDGGKEDNSEFLNDVDEGMVIEARGEAQTSNDCDDGSYNAEPLAKHGEVC